VARGRVQRLEIHPEHPEPHRIRQAVARLQSGIPVIYPTDSLYGIAADSSQSAAMQRLYSLRRHDPKKPLSLVCTDLAQVGQFATFSTECFRFMKRCLPGPYTLILSATKSAPRMGQSKRRTIGIRIPAHPVAQALASSHGSPLLSTSVREETDDVQDPVEIAEWFGAHEIGVVLDAGILKGRASTVIDWTGDEPAILRRGAGPVDDLE
jgi:tRNA threonylcarbamoyl adenosine modification protein (Sua5/YciO/YrdC/YwlC family)